MNRFSWIRYGLLACLVAFLTLSCNATGEVSSSGDRIQATNSPAAERLAPVSQTRSAGVPSIINDAGTIRVEPLPVDLALRNEWPAELETAFWERANQAIRYYAGQEYGNTSSENEKRSYPLAMFDFLAGDREKAIDFLQREDAQASDHEQTEGIDYYYCFTLKGQIRKYFFFGNWLDPDYRQRMAKGAAQWTERDPLGRPHPIYGNGNGEGDDWSPRRRGGWVDSRNTDNLRAMREVAVYLMAEETGNEETRQLYKEKLQRYVGALYNIGMGEWDSENYHGHTFAAYLNLYDFAKDSDVQQLSKAALDWLSAAAALKYYHGGWGGPTKRDLGKSNVVFGSAAARFFWLYFGDAAIPNPEPERDIIHAITSAYRPPLAVMALAHKQFDRPVELLNTKPTYENWLPDKDDTPAYWETVFVGQTYQMGSVVSSSGDGDVGSFKLMADNSQRGVDFFAANTGKDWVSSGKNRRDQIGQYQNLLIWLSPADNQPFAFQLPKTARIEAEEDIWFVELENTWLALHPINLSGYETVEPSDDQAENYPDEQGLKADVQGDRYAGFALEVGSQSDSSYRAFKQAVQSRSRLNLDAIAQGNVELTSSTGATLKLVYNTERDRPQVIRDGIDYDWASNTDLYRPATGNAPISLGWKQGKLIINVTDTSFETTVSTDGVVNQGNG